MDRFDSYKTDWTGQNYVIKATLDRTGIHGLSQPDRTGDRDGLSYKEQVGQDRRLGWFVPLRTGRTGQETGMVCPLKKRQGRKGDLDCLFHKKQIKQGKRQG